jgi:hypothetical protein
MARVLVKHCHLVVAFHQLVMRVLAMNVDQ